MYLLYLDYGITKQHNKSYLVGCSTNRGITVAAATDTTVHAAGKYDSVGSNMENISLASFNKNHY